MKTIARVFAASGLLLLSLVAFADTNCVTPPSGLQSWWAADGDAGDLVGIGAGALVNGATFATGLVGQALSLNGTNAYVRLPDNIFPFPPAAPASTPFSFETWFKTTSGGVILGQQLGVPFANVSGWVPSIYIRTDGKLSVEVFWNGSVSPVVSTQTVSDGVFHHVAATFDGASESVYFDGLLLTNHAFSQVSYASSYSYQLGIGYTSGWPNGNGGWFPFNGLIDEATLYNRSLSSNEVAAIYAVGAAGKCKDSLPPFITRQPASFDGPVGSTMTLSVGVKGSMPLSYQWQFYGTNLPAGTDAALLLSNTALIQAGPYSVAVSNAFGAVQSATGVVTVVFPLVLDTVVSNGAPFVGAGNLESAGAQDVYTFDAPPSRAVYLGVLNAFNRLFWSLSAPDGSVVFTGRYMPYDDVRRLELPMHGSYRLVVFNDSGITGSYSFKLLAPTDQTFTLAVGDTVTNGLPAAGAGNIEMSGSHDDYLFTAPGNGVVNLSVLSAFNRLFWSLTAPDGTAVFTGRYMPYNDVGRVQLPEAGTYRLRVYNDDQFTGNYSFKLWADADQTFNLSVGDTVTNGAPTAGAGNLETPGTWDDYLFTAPSNRLVFFDALLAFTGLRWSLFGPDETAVFSGRYMPYNDVGRVLLPHAGTYRLRIYADIGYSGPYSFRLTGITDQVFAITADDAVTNAMPAAGAGSLESPGCYDDYLFAGTTNQAVYFDVLSAPFRLFWTLAAPDGSTVFSGRYMPYNDVRRVQLPMAGSYRLRVYSDTDATGNYSFKLWSIVDQSFNLAVGDNVTNGVPVAGAGNLEMPGSYDDYLFSAPTNRSVYFDVLSAPYRLFWTLFAPDGSVPFSGHYLPYNDVGRVDLPLAGIYRLRVYGDSDSFGPYSFKLWNVVDQFFNISIGNVVTNGVPVAGAGVLQSPAADDLYSFSASAGQSVRFNDRNSSPRVASWRLVAPGGTQLFSDNLDGSDPGTFTLTASGTYYLHVRNNSRLTPVSYSFALLDNGTNSFTPVAAQQFAIALGDIVSNGVPASGAGNIETAGALDVYTFTSGVGQVVYFEDRNSAGGQIRYDLYDSQWTRLFGEWLNNSQDIGRQTLSRGGTYYLVASGNNNTATGAYSFKLWPVSDQLFNIALGDTVTNDVPGPGAGNIETPGLRDVYTFTATPGQVVFFEDRGSTPNRQIRYDLYDERGTFLFGEWLGNDQEVGRQTLARGGTYTLIVSGSANITGAYSLKLWPITGDQSFAISIGDTVTNGLPALGAGNLEAPGVRDVYTFTATSGQEVYFEDRGGTPNRQIRYDAYDARNTWLFGEWLGNDQEVGRQTLVLGGAYTLVVSGNGNTTGTYSFRLWPASGDQNFAVNLGDTITNGLPATGAGSIETPGVRDIYTFMAAPGQVIYFEDRGASNNRNIRYDVYDDRGVFLFGEWLGNDQEVGRQTLSRGGLYTLIASGYGNSIGTYSLKLWAVPDDQSFTINIGDTITNGVPSAGAASIEVPGARDIYTFIANPEQLVYFEDRGASNNRNIRYDVYDQNWTFLFGEWLGNDQEVGLRRLTLGGAYHVVASGYWNNTGTYSLRLWDALPHILQQPLSVRGSIGQPQTFAVKAENPYPLAFQWRLYGTNLPGATNALLNLPAPPLSQAGPYDVVVSNPYGAVTSVVAVLTLDASECYVAGFAPGASVATNVSQLRVQFNSPILASSFGTDQIAIVGPSGPLDSSGFGIVALDSQSFLVNIPPQSIEGAYTVSIGPAITNQAGASMTGSAFSPLYTSDFESGAGGAWSRGETLSNSVSSRFLGEFANDTATLFLANLPAHNRLRLTWDTLILDTWDGNLSPGPDYFGFNLAGLPQPAWEYAFHASGNPLVQSYPGTPDVNAVNFAGTSATDSIYRNLSFNFSHTNDTLEISFYGRNLQGVNDEGWGLDNVRVLTQTASNGVFTASFIIDKTGPQLAGVSPSGTSLLPVGFLDVTFNEPIQPQSFTTNDVLLKDPLGQVIGVSAPQRLSATSYRLSFASQRYNGAYNLVLGPAVLDLAGNGMAAAAANTFNILTPPAITTQPVSQTVVRNNNVSFTVAAAATPPVQFQWTANSVPIQGATNATLTLLNVQTNQAGSYQVTVTDAGGSTLSAPAVLTVLPSYGPFIAQAQAARLSVPAVPGNGVYIELFNGTGGGTVPAPSLVAGLTPSGTTLSPVIDFPHPGSVINVGSSFNNFFQDTTRPPDQVLGLSALNFILRNTFYLAISRANDLHPETPEVDVRLGVGSDDGFYLLVGTNFIGSGGDRPFAYSWMDVSFEDQGLYPITLYYAANAVGQSGLELSWQIGTNALTQIVPQSALYISPDLGDRLITFEELPAGTSVSNQYAGTGIVFTTVSGALQVTTNFPTRFVPVSPIRVLADSNAAPAVAGILDLTFVAPDATNPATSDFVSFFLINAQSDLAMVTAFDSGGHLLFTNSYHGGGASQELVTINAHGIARVRVNLGQDTNSAAIDNLAFLSPVSLPDLIVDDIETPPAVIAGQPVQLVWRVTNQGFHAAQGPWTDTIALSADGTPVNSQLLTSVIYSNLLPAGASLMVTQSVIIPANQVGSRWFVITTDASHAFVESGSVTNNISVAPVLTIVQAPDLAAQVLSAPANAQFGQTVNISWIVRNAGNASANALWNDRLLFSVNSNSLFNSSTLLTTPAPNLLPPGATYTNIQTVTLPLNGTLNPGTYYLVLQIDPDGAVADSSLTNNLLAVPITLTLPPLPDLVVGQVSSPPAASAGNTVQVSWAVTNLGAVAATGPWWETVHLVPASVSLNQFTTNAGAYSLIGAFSYNDSIPAGASVARTQQVTIPMNGPAGGLRLAVLADSDNSLLEQNEGNNSALAANALQVAATLFLTIPITNVMENTSTPNLPCLVSRNGDLTAPVVVSLSSSAANHLQVPASITIPAGAGAAPFTAAVLDDGVFGPDSSVEISAIAAGYLSATSSVLVANTDLPRLALSLSAAQIIEGQTVTATLTSDTASSLPLVVSLVNSSPSRLAGPGSVTIPAYSNSATFTLFAVDNTLIEPTHTYSVTASASGHASASTSLTVFDNDAPALVLALDRTNISEGDGPLAVVATVSRQPVTDLPLTLALASTNPAAALVPAQVIIPGFQAQATFNVAAVKDALVTGPKLTLLSAQALDAQGTLVGTPASQELVVQDDDGPALKVRITNKVVAKGLAPATTGVVWRNTPPTNDLTVTLSSSATNQAVLATTLIIPTGQTNATFTISSLNDGVPNSSHAATITASATGYASGSDLLIVTDLGLPDLVITSVTAPAAAFSAEPVTLGFRLANQGLGPLTNAISQSVFLATNPPSGNSLLVGSVSFSGSLAPGQYVDQSLFVPGGASIPPGSYWTVVTADTDSSAVELNKANNTTVSVTPTVFTLEYAAMVKAGVTNVVAGTPVPLSGSATLLAGGPAANKPVNIVLTVRGLQRVFGVITDTNGNFSTVFTPLPTEAGFYTVGAVAPGASQVPVQDHFTILGMTLNPAALSLSVIEGGSASGSVSLRNMSEVPLTGLTATVNGLPSNLTGSATLGSNMLSGLGAITLGCSVTAADATIRQGTFSVHVTCNEGVPLDLPVTVTVQPLLPRLATLLPQLSGAMLRGAQTIVKFDVINLGGAASGPLTVNIPVAPWLSLASTNPLPSLAPGESNRVTLVLAPATNLALGPYTGTMTVNGSSASLQIPFSFTAVSDARGALRVRSVDEFTFFAVDTPPLTNASVTLIEPFSHSVIASGVTDTNGVFLAPALTEGTYELDLTADKHAPFRGAVIVSAGQTNDVEAFLSRQTVQYTWTVEPTQVQDVTHITVQAEFEANVPAPVIVPSPTSIDVAPLDQPGKFMDVPLTLANYGLIAVHGVTISITPHPLYQFDLLTRDLGTLPAHGTVTVPMRITRLPDSGPNSVRSPKTPGGPCTISIGIGYLFLCGKYDVSTGIAIPVFNVTGDCGGGGGTIVAVGCDGCTGGTIVIPPGTSVPSDCDQCMAKAILECAIGYIPNSSCPYGTWSCLAGVIDRGLNAETGENCIVMAIGCAGDIIGEAKENPYVSPIVNTATCLWSFLRCKCAGAIETVPACVWHALGGGGGAAKSRMKDATIGQGLSPFDPRDVYAARSYFELAWLQMLLGDTDGRWFSPGSGGAFGAWFVGFAQSTQSNSPSATLISSAERATLLALPRPNTVSDADIQATVDRWNLTINNWRAGIYSPTNVPAGGNTNFIDIYALSDLMVIIGQQYLASQASGFDSPVGGFLAAINDAEKKLGGGGVCARVVLQLDQDAVLTRDAFRATLELNNSSADPLLNVGVNLVVRNQLGEDVSGVFGILPPSMSGGLSTVDGTGSLAPNSSGAARWVLLPTQDAAPEARTNYLVSGTFTYTQNGVTVNIPLAPAPINVLPNPRLFVKYFHQRDVFADDPLTPQIEPSVPYSLAVMVQNRGFGSAYNFQITSAQPKIVDNEKGLLIDFKIVGSQVGSQPVSPSLTVAFGDLPPGANRTGRWLLTSTLQGQFIDYSATFQHVDPLGNPRLSLIEGVEIHELLHLVRAGGMWDDGQPDFLVNDIPDFNTLPDTLYLSDGRIQPVSVVQVATTDGPVDSSHLQIQLTADVPAGWTYVRLPDPANGQFPLLAVRRADGTNLLAENFWITDRTFIGLGQRPIRENVLHLFDYHTNSGPAIYTLVYAAPSSLPDTNAPVSAVFALPPRSPQTFGLVWGGADYAGESGLAWFDIFTSDNSGPFTLWRAHTTDTGALFGGAPGHTYAFYSLATDNAGNVEAPPATPDAVTTVNLSNTPPTISLGADLSVNEGDTVHVTPTVGDTDTPPETFSFRFGPGAPAGAAINPATGLITWSTTELDGPSSNLLTVIVTDNGFPPLSATSAVRIVVSEVNSPPNLESVVDRTINEGILLAITNRATDFDLPTNTLTFSLGPGAPSGASINPANGVFLWRPSSTQGPSTNLITVIVTDNGLPPLSATRQFTVIVRDVLPDFSLAVGSTNVMTGESGIVPVTLASTTALTNITFQIGADAVRLTNLALQSAAAEVTSTTLQPLNSNSYAASFTLDPALQLSSVRALARLEFLAVSNPHSAIVPVTVSPPTGQLADGQAVPRATGTGGRVFIVATEPLLDLAAGPALTLYGHPGANYALEYRTNLASGAWLEFSRLALADRFVRITNSPSSSLMAFYRAYEMPSFGISLEFHSSQVHPFESGPPASSLFSLTLRGQPGVAYTMQTATNLLPVYWSDLFTVTLTNAVESFNWTNLGEPTRYFRVLPPLQH